MYSSTAERYQLFKRKPFYYIQTTYWAHGELLSKNILPHPFASRAEAEGENNRINSIVDNIVCSKNSLALETNYNEIQVKYITAPPALTIANVVDYITSYVGSPNERRREDGQFVSNALAKELALQMKISPAKARVLIHNETIRLELEASKELWDNFSLLLNR